MNIYEQLNLKTIINASDTYTHIGGSRMSEGVLDAMREASKHFVDIVELNRAVSAGIARMTRNKAAFVSSGAAACVVLTAAWLITRGDPALALALPDISGCPCDEILVFDAQTAIPTMRYWHLIELSGAKLVRIGPRLDDLEKAIRPKTAGMFLFAADLYEVGLPPISNVIALARAKGIRIIVNAAAQLPPKSNLWHYTEELGADGAIFSGGKFIMGPQSTGIFLGCHNIAEGCYGLTCPNVSIGRPFKVGKEELIGIYTAVKQFVEKNEEQLKIEQHARLDVIEDALACRTDITIRRVCHGRLGQDAPMLIIDLPDGKTWEDCAKYLYDCCDPAIDIGYYRQWEHSGTPQRIFINSINLRNDEPEYVAESLKLFLAR